MIRKRAAAIIINEDKILVLHRFFRNENYSVFPGGGVDDGETIEEAVLREVKEETSLEVKIEKLLYHVFQEVHGNKSEQFFYLCRYITGEPKLSEGNESEEMKKGDTNTWNPAWHKIEDLPQLNLLPKQIKDWFIEDFKTHFKVTPRETPRETTL